MTRWRVEVDEVIVEADSEPEAVEKAWSVLRIQARPLWTCPDCGAEMLADHSALRGCGHP